MFRPLLQRLGLAFALVSGPAILIEACDQTSTTSATKHVADIELATATGTVTGIGIGLKVGAQLQLSAVARDATGAPIPGATIAWASSAPSVATVTQQGLVTGVTPGTTTVTASSGTVTASLALTVLDTTVPPPPTGTTLFADDFTSGASYQWTGLVGSWSTVSDGSNVWKQSNLSGDYWGVVGSTAWKDYSIQARVKVLAWNNGTGIARIFARWQNTTNWLYLNVAQNGTLQLRKYVNGTITDLAPPKAMGFVPGTFYTLKLAVQGTTITASVNGTVQLTATDATFTAGPAAVGGWNSTAEFDDVLVTDLSGTTPPPPPVTVVGSVSVAPATAGLAIGATQQLTATVKDTAGTTISGQAVAWTSLHPSWATVSSSGLVTGVAAGVDTVTATSSGKVGRSIVTVSGNVPPPPAGSVGHVVIVLEENTNYSSSIGSMPWLDAQIVTGGSATSYYATTHPSIGNYFMLTTGQNITNNDSYSTDVSVDNVIRQLNKAGKTWKGYAEDLPSPGYLNYGSTGGYATKHFPLVYFTDVRQDPNVAQKIVPFTQFATDLRNGTLPNYSFIAPNLCNDAHDCSLGTADTWLKNNIAPLLTQSQFSKDGLLIVTFDESGGDNTNGGGKVEWVAMGPMAKHGFKSGTTYLHQSTLRTMLQALGVTSYPGAAASAPYMGEFLNTTVGTTPPPPPPATGSCATWSGSTITLSGLSTTPYQNTSMANGTRIDATRAQWLLNQPSTWNRMDGGAGACWMGGQIMGSFSPALPYADNLQGYHLAYNLIADGASARVENANLFTGGDGIAFDTQGASNWIVRGVHMRYSRDDCIENDFLNSGLVDDVLAEGCYTFISSRTYTGSPDGTNNTVTVQNSLAWLEGTDANYYGESRPGSGGMWKWVGSGWPNNGNGPSLVINNSVFRADAAPVEGEGSGEYFAPPKLKSCSNNVLVWLGSGTMPRAWPSCFTVMTGQAGLDYWNQKVADWKARHPAGADFTPPIVALFRIPATLSGTVQLTATAVDDQTLAGVTFNLSGAAIGAIPADHTDHAILSWDSRGKANGSYALTATARDAAGHSTTSVSVPVTVSN